MARDQQRTRLNAELAHQYGSVRKRGDATPGRASLAGELDDKQQDALAGELEEPQLDEQAEAAAEHEQAPDAELAPPAPKKSIFELPRKEPTRQPLPDSPFSPGKPEGE